MIFVQRLVIEASSCALSVPGRIGFSVVPKPAPCAWIVVLKPSPPLAISGFAALPATAAALVQLVPVKFALAPVGITFTTTELGRTPVSVLLTMSFLIDSDTSPFGVTRQEQQLTSCSSGENP